MVDALKESWRVLHNDGVLLDFRPLVDAPPIEIVSRESAQEVGSVDDSAAASDSGAADRALRTVVESGSSVHSPTRALKPRTTGTVWKKCRNTWQAVDTA
jgi:hypothetical protein